MDNGSTKPVLDKANADDDYAKKLWDAKIASRSELKTPTDWNALEFASSFDSSFASVKDNVGRIDASHVSYEEFVKKYETTYTPVVIKNAQKSWKAGTAWTPKELLEKHGHERFKVGEDDDGYSVRLKMEYYLKYFGATDDDSPLYIFDSSFVERTGENGLVKDYTVPEYFADDLFSYAESKRRPPYRWFVMGPARSGTGIHIDPLGTSAWNALVHGYKRWCLLPTCVPKELLKVSRLDAPRQTNEAVSWFKYAYPRTQRADWPNTYRPLEILQQPGETVFIPGGWWHVVVNLTDTVAVTQNFASVVNFPIVWHKTVRGRPKLAQHWYKTLQTHRPEIAAIADQVDLTSNTGVQSDDSSSCSSSSSSSSSSSGSDSEDDGETAKRERRKSGSGMMGKRARDSPDSGQGSLDSKGNKAKKVKEDLL